MAKFHRTHLIAMGLILIAVLMAPFGCFYVLEGGPYFRFEPVEIHVVDYILEQPLPGTVVAARWYFSSGISFHGENIRGEAGIAEGVTDASGRVVLVPRRTRRRWNQFVSERSPRIFVHKAGYVIGSEPPWNHTDWSVRPRKYYLIPPDAFADGAESFARTAGAVASDIRLSGYHASSLPRIEREIRLGYGMLSPNMQREVDQRLGGEVKWLPRAAQTRAPAD